MINIINIVEYSIRWRAEICRLIGSFILNQLGSVIDKNDIERWYRDDSLRLAITIECNLKIVNFLDITFDLPNNVYKPYRNANGKPTYMNKNSNHPPSILKQLTKSIKRTLSETSSSKNIFDKSLKVY